MNTLTDPDCPPSVREKLAAKADRIADIIERNNFRQNEKVEDAKQIALELARELRALSVRDQINGGVTQEARAVAAEKPRYWKHQRAYGFHYACCQLHFTSKEAGFRWVAEYSSDETEAAKAGWADDAPFFTSNIWADVPAPSEREQLEARVKDDLDWFSGQHSLSINHYSPFYCDDVEQSVEWRVIKEGGSINDREFDVIGRGETVADAITAARAALQEQRP